MDKVLGAISLHEVMYLLEKGMLLNSILFLQTMVRETFHPYVFLLEFDGDDVSFRMISKGSEKGSYTSIATDNVAKDDTFVGVEDVVYGDFMKYYKDSWQDNVWYIFDIITVATVVRRRLERFNLNPSLRKRILIDTLHYETDSQSAMTLLYGYENRLEFQTRGYNVEAGELKERLWKYKYRDYLRNSHRRGGFSSFDRLLLISGERNNPYDAEKVYKCEDLTSLIDIILDGESEDIHSDYESLHVQRYELYPDDD